MLLDLRLDAGFYTGDPVSHRIDTVLVRVGFIQRFELLFAGIESLTPVDALGFTGLNQDLLRVLSLG